MVVGVLVAAASPVSAVTECRPDVGDSQEFGRRPVRAQADLVEVCSDWDVTATLLLRPADVPSVDELGRYGDLDVLVGYGDPEFPDFAISMRLRRGQLVAESFAYVYDFEGPGPFFTETRTCGIPVKTTGAAFVVGPFDPACVGGGQEVSVFVSWLHSLDGFADDVDGDWWPGAGYPETAVIQRFGMRPTGRIAGPTRIDTAAAISATVFGTASSSVYLARADAVTDAIAGGALTDGPILLVPPCGEVPGPVRAEIDRLNPGRVVALGGEGAVCEQLLAAAGAGRSTDRLAGDSRITTSLAIASAAFPDGAEELYLARGSDPVDAVAGGALTRGPVIVVPDCGDVPDEVDQLVATLNPSTVVALGGTGAVCDQVLSDVAKGRDTGRLAGKTRSETALAIAGYQYPEAASVVFVAREDQVADAVAGGVLPGAPILLVPGCEPAADAILGYTQQQAVHGVVALGGAGALCDFSLRYVAGIAW